jgi:hypothetical protein
LRSPRGAAVQRWADSIDTRRRPRTSEYRTRRSSERGRAATSPPNLPSMATWSARIKPDSEISETVA